jgi:hypothetical protein
MTSVIFTMVSNTYKRGYDGKQMLRILILVGELTLAGLAVVWRMGSSRHVQSTSFWISFWF